MKNIQGYINPLTIELDNYNNFGNEKLIMSTCYFDHKVSKQFGSWPQIYLDGNLFD